MNENKGKWYGTAFLTFLAAFWIFPILCVLWNSFKVKTAINLQPFQLPNSETLVGMENYAQAVDKYGLLDAVGWTVFITVFSVAAILICCSMTGWFITRVQNKWTKLIYTLCIFSMVVHAVTGCQPSRSDDAMGHHRHLPGIRRRSCGVHVYGICPFHSD